MRLPPPERKNDYLSREEVARLLAAVDADTQPHREVMAVAVRLAIYAGLRVCEVYGLRWRSVDFDRNVIVIRHGFRDSPTKSRRARHPDRRSAPRAPRVVAQALPVARLRLSDVFLDDAQVVCGSHPARHSPLLPHRRATHPIVAVARPAPHLRIAFLNVRRWSIDAPAHLGTHEPHARKSTATCPTSTSRSK